MKKYSYLIIILLLFFTFEIKAQVKGIEIYVTQVTKDQIIYEYKTSNQDFFAIKYSDRYRFNLDDLGRSVSSVLDSVPLTDEQAKQVEFIKLRCSVIQDSLPITAQRFPNLKTFYIESNFIGDLKGISDFKKLKRLIIQYGGGGLYAPRHYSYCNLKEISKLDSLKYLHIEVGGHSGPNPSFTDQSDIDVFFDLSELYKLKKLQKVTGDCFPLETMIKMPWVQEFGHKWASIDCFLFLQLKYGRKLDIKEIEEKYPIFAKRVYNNEKKKFLFTTKNTITANSTFTIYSLDKKTIMKGTYKNGQRDGIWSYYYEYKTDEGYDYKSNNESVYKNGVYIKGSQLYAPKGSNNCFGSQQEVLSSIETHKFSNGYTIINEKKVISCNKNNPVHNKEKNITEEIKTDTIICVRTNDKYYVKTSRSSSNPKIRIVGDNPLNGDIIYSIYDFAKPIKYLIIIDNNKMIYNSSSAKWDYVEEGNDTTVIFTENRKIDGKVTRQTSCICSTHGFVNNYNYNKYYPEKSDFRFETCRATTMPTVTYSPSQLEIETCNDCKAIIYDNRIEEIKTLQKIFLPYEEYLNEKYNK